MGPAEVLAAGRGAGGTEGLEGSQEPGAPGKTETGAPGSRTSGRTLEQVAAAVRWPEHETRLLLGELERDGIAERLNDGTWALTAAFEAEFGAAFRIWAEGVRE